MKRLIVFDLDGTIAESKSSLDDEMSTLLRDRLGIVKVADISGGNWPQIEKQLVSNLPHDANLENLSLLPTSASGLVDLHRESIWISYCSTALADCEPLHLCHFGSHHRLAAAEAAWEQFKIGGGTPPILVSLTSPRKLCYSAGVLVLSEELPQVIRFRSREPALIPELPQEREGIVAIVVFPTGMDRRDDPGSPDRFDVHYGMADNRIGVARLDVPKHLPSDKEVEP